uniref:UDP-glucose 6-dehydrogenase n=1 Tax=Rhodopseudomonas palustris (strain BisA53) TaxID=316055 RepID=Q07KU9_RHOP5
MDIAVVGSGYVGLVAGACLASLGHCVICVDRDADRIARLNAGEVPIHEPALDRLIAVGLAGGALRFGTSLAEAVLVSEIVFIAVGTPTGGDGSADLSCVREVVREISDVLPGPRVIVVKSTVPVGTGDEIELILGERHPPKMYDVVSNPEFLREGRAVADFLQPDRIVIGAATVRGRAAMKRLYDPAQFADAPVLFIARRSAELTKYAANAFLASKVAFINDVSDLCERAGADVQDVAHGMGLDPRIGPDFLRPGPGYGGSCFPKDTRALLRIARDLGAPDEMFSAVVAANEMRKRSLAQRVVAACGGSVAGLEIALLGLTFKADTDDMRESPALALIAGLQGRGARVRAYDPAGMSNAGRLTRNVAFAKDAMSCVEAADAAVVVTDWPEFAGLDLANLAVAMASPLLIDLRNVFDPDAAAARGLSYVGVGRGTRAPAFLAHERSRIAIVAAE